MNISFIKNAKALNRLREKSQIDDVMFENHFKLSRVFPAKKETEKVEREFFIVGEKYFLFYCYSRAVHDIISLAEQTSNVCLKRAGLFKLRLYDSYYAVAMLMREMENFLDNL